MNTLVKIGVASAMALGYASAHASVAQPNSGSSDLILFVQDTVTGVTYARDTGISLNNALPTSQLLASGSATSNFVDTINVASLPTSLAADANLTSFLTTAGTDSVQWAIEGAQFPTTANNANDSTTGSSKWVTTTSQAASHVTSVKVGNANIALTAFNQSVTTLNGVLGANSSTATNGVWGEATAQGGAAASLNWNGNGPTTSGVLLNGSSVLYGLTGNGTTGQMQSYNLASVSLSSAGLLTFTANPVVPIPAAIWLFGSGLLGLAGVGRRRSVQA